MLVDEFNSTCPLYEGFEVWEIESLTSFFNGNTILPTIFRDQYNISVAEIEEKRREIVDSDYDIITKLLGRVNDKFFYIFTLHDKNHLDLIEMQLLKVMNFGVDIEKIRADCVYAIIMDKRSS